jgi:hypothetical protein
MSTLRNLVEEVGEADLYLQTLSDNPSLAGITFEAMVLIIIAFRMQSPTAKVYDRNMVQLTPRQILKLKINRGNAEGRVDIRYKTNGQWKFVSAKFHADDSSHSMEDYDLDRLNGEASSPAIDWEAVLWVNDKYAVRKKLALCHDRKFKLWLKPENIYGLDDLANYWKILVFIGPSNFLGSKPPLTALLRPHQNYTIEKAQDLFVEHNEILFAHLMRSGKTMMAGGYIAQARPSRVLIITPQPKETFSQYNDDILDKYSEFSQYDIMERFKDRPLERLNRKDVIVIDSKQYLDRAVMNDVIPFDLIISDENDLGGTTGRLYKTIQGLKHSTTKIIYMTYTANKSIAYNRIPERAILRWELNDIDAVRTLTLESKMGLRDRYGERMIELIDMATPEAIESYNRQPRIAFLTATGMSPKIKELLALYVDTVYGFNFATLFQLNKAKTGFQNAEDVRTLISSITGSYRAKLYPKGDTSYFSQMQNCRCSHCTLNPRGNQKWFHIFYLPTAKGLKMLLKCSR